MWTIIGVMIFIILLVAFWKIWFALIVGILGIFVLLFDFLKSDLFQKIGVFAFGSFIVFAIILAIFS